jgi:putative IMPACT (imprinted ancient) family translation regulator
LGAGGLIRAYGGAARLVLREAPRKTLIPKTSFRVLVPSTNSGSVYDAAAKVGGVTSDEEYSAEGDFIVTLTCDTQHETRLRTSLTDATRGSVEFLNEREADES